MEQPDAAPAAAAAPETELWIAEFLLAHPECSAPDPGLAGPLIDLAYRPLFERHRAAGAGAESLRCASLNTRLLALAPDKDSAQFFAWFLQLHLEDYAAMPSTESAAREILAAAEQTLLDRSHPQKMAAARRKNSV